MNYLSELIVCACLLAVAWPALAATVTVSNTNDDGAGSLRAAIATALPGDTIEFALTYPATITLSNTLFITQNVKIHGPGPSNLAISGSDVEAFFISPGVSAAISGMHIFGRNFNSALNAGGAIYNAGRLTLTNITVAGFSDVGGGIYNAGTLTLTNSTVSALATIGGGIGNVGTLNIAYSTFQGNYAIASGAGIWSDGGTVNILNSTFTGGGTDDFSGGGIAHWDGTMTVTNSTFSGNNAQGSGGGIFSFGELTVTNSTFSGNDSSIHSSGTLIVKNTILEKSVWGIALGQLLSPPGTISRTMLHAISQRLAI